MKKRWSFLLSAVVVMLATIQLAPRANAIVCVNSTDYGAVSLMIPELPHSGEYALWVRLQSPTEAGSLSIDIDNSSCIDISTPKTSLDQWVWVPYGPTGQPYTIRFDQESKHTLTVIGKTNGLKVDSVVLSEPGCVPKNLGENCSTKVTAIPTAPSDIEQLPSPSDEPVSGKIKLSDSPYRFNSMLEKLQYTVDGKTLQQSKTAEPFDTTLLADGTYTVMITSTLVNGEVIRESTVLAIENPTNAMSPIIRWVRINLRSIVAWALIAAGVIAFLLLCKGIRRFYLYRRERHFHGF